MAGDKRPRAVTFGCAGPALSKAEAKLFRQADPVGFVLFRRNCETPDQVYRLVQSMREAVGRHAPVLIDQEGGRVQRLRPPAWPDDSPARAFGALHARDPGAAIQAVGLMARAVASDLARLGIDVNAVPVADLAWPGAHDVIGDRAFSGEVDTVVALARAQAEAHLAHGVMPIVKHLPGHGRAQADSHLDLPVIDAPIDELTASDLRPFQALADLPWGMTAHILLTAIDGERPGTQSPAVIERIIRGTIGFDGVLVSDDLSMQALSGPIDRRAVDSLAAGCDIALHCNGDLAEMEALAGAVPPLSNAAMDRLARAEALRGTEPPVDSSALRQQVQSLLGL
jgi:beta-N-acetylhexosaminidase